jgi:hypothetical protein
LPTLLLSSQMMPLMGAILREASDYRLVSALFLRLLALVYLVAFVSIGVQIVGLAGAEGILPFAQTLQGMEDRLGVQAYWRYPNLFWIDASDLALQGAAVLGCVFSVLLFCNVLPRVSLVALFVLYLSLFHAGQIFLNFQWDYLLLESGFLAIFLPGRARLVIWLFRWLLFRFRFLSGASKLLSQDPSWADLTALRYYFETQPLPHVGSWYAHQLPDWLLSASTASALFIELAVPFMMFMPRGPRFFAAWATILMQLLIILTSNHAFANILTIVLCLFLFDDRALTRVMPASLTDRLTRGPSPVSSHRPAHTAAVITLAAFVFGVSGIEMGEMFSGRRSPQPVATVLMQIRGLRIVNRYHVFPTIKTERMEIIIEGSQDGEHWRPYRFRYRPGDPARRPRVVLPHSPRLDWMMWFVPMDPVFLPWFQAFLYRLLENAPGVLELLETHPFPLTPPRFLRAELYRYRFTDAQTRESTGQWWRREYLGPFYPLPWVRRAGEAHD